MTLYDIDSAIRDFEFTVAEDTGEVTNFDALDALQMEREAKIENIALYIKNLTALSADIKAEKNNLDERMKAAERKADSLKRYLASSLNGEKFETARCKVSYRKSAQVVVSDTFTEWAKQNAPELVTETLTIKPDKAAIKNAIKSGKQVVGAEIVENTNISIK